jgi:uncharacterized protein (DUF58 family)
MLGIRRLALIGGITVGLFALGLVTRRGEILALALLFVTFQVAGICFSIDRKAVKITAKRFLSKSRIYGGDEVEVTVEITNSGIKLEEVYLADVLPWGLKVVEGETSVVSSLDEGDKIKLSYTVVAERGYFEFKKIKALVVDALGFSPLELDVSVSSSLFVLPRYEDLRDIKIRPRRTHVYSGVVRANEGGPGVEFFSVREYRWGDEFRWINWKATARHGRLITNEFEQERVADVIIVLDARERSDICFDGKSLFEHSVQAAASFVRFFIRQGNNVGLLIYGGFLSWVFPGYGRLQEERLMRALAKAEKGESIVFEELENIPARLFPKKSQLMLISPLTKDDVEILRRLRFWGWQIMVVSPNPVEFELESLPKTSSTEFAARIASLEREITLDKLRQAEIRVVDWNVNQPLRIACGGLKIIKIKK